MVTELTKQNFNEIVKSDKPVLVDFWASWCGPCRMVSPIIDQIAEEYEGKITVGKVNVDDEAALATEFAIVSIPTIILFKDGKEVKKLVGAQSADDYADAIDAIL
ncbi:MAG: thioredoxin [Clostridia bacterium]|nr:thioredoxin [Clostridia bacterium]